MSVAPTPYVSPERAFPLRWLMRDWLPRITVLLTGLLILQYVLWIEQENLWLPETFRLALYTLLITALVELFTRLHWALRTVIQLAALWFLHWATLDIHPVSLHWKRLWQGVAEYAVQYFPELGTSLGVWAIYVVALWWVRSKARIYLLLIVSVIAIAVRDSFSLLILWDQAAVIIFCGIGLLVARHFSELKAKDPASWAYLSEYPSTVMVPVMLLIVITLGIGISMPGLPPLLPDPYTAWKLWKGETVTSVGKGIGYFTVTQLDSSSGYSRSDQELGGGFNYDFAPLMTVDTNQRSYWRGETKTYYTGRGWEQRADDRQPMIRVNEFGAVLPTDDRVRADKLKTIEVTQTFTLLNDQAYPVLFGAPTIERIIGMTSGVDSASQQRLSPLSWLPDRSQLVWFGSSRAYPKQYTVVSRMPVIDEAGLRTAGMEAYSRPEWRNELQLPDTLPARVRQLAIDITKNEPTPYDKVKAIERYLSTTYAYNNKPDLSKGRSRDFVDRFLFEIKEGYCDYFSTAMAVMVRSIGIPSRWVKGFTAGVSEEEAELGLTPEELDPSGAGLYTVRNADAHSWVEVYFEGWGWIPFEPTAGFVLPVAYVEDETELAPAGEWSDFADAENSTLRLALRATGWIAAALLAVFAVLLLWKYGLLERLLWWRRREGLTFNERIVFEFERFLRFCRRKGYIRHDHETARETLLRWMETGSSMKEDLIQLLTVFERAKYGKSPLNERDWAYANAIMQKLRSQM